MSTRSITSHPLVFSLIFILLLSLPFGARAAVVINEIMYNPEGSDSGREWIELYNSGAQDVTLVGGSGAGSWRVVDSQNHTLVAPPGNGGRGSLSVPAGGYLVVASDPAAFIAEYPSGDYSVVRSAMSLNNTGATISLVDGEGATVSSVTYAASQGGDDNGTSLQEHLGEWLQALPTPGALNAIERYDPPASESNSESSNKSNSTSNPGYVLPPLPQLFADAGGDRTVVVGADSKFVATAYDRDRDVINYAKFFWNFGDGSVAEGPWVMHHFSYPGRYAVELTITNTDIKSTSRITVTAQPASVSLLHLPQGGVSIKNGSDRDLDLSLWQVRQEDNTFALPEHSVVLRGSAINVAPETLGFAATSAKLFYPNGTEVVAAAVPEPETRSAPEPSVQATTTLMQSEPQKATSSPAPLVSAPEEPAASAQEVVPPTSEQAAGATLPAAVAASDAAFPLWASLAGLGGVVGLGVASVWYARRPQSTRETRGVAGEFTIE